MKIGRTDMVYTEESLINMIVPTSTISQAQGDGFKDIVIMEVGDTVTFVKHLIESRVLANLPNLVET